MIDQTFKILEHKPLTKDVFLLKLEGNTQLIKHPGQFINIKVDSFYLRRPISVADVEGSILTILYRVIGLGTKALSLKKEGDCLNCLVGLGNGFSVTGHSRVALVGGGIGIPPLYGLAKQLIKQGKQPVIILGYQKKEDVFGLDLFEELGVEMMVCTDDGSYGKKGLVTDALKELDVQYLYACGPEPMLRALYRMNLDGQYSLEARMACGFGACMGCSIETQFGPKRVCKEGPVFQKGELLWPTH